MLEDRVFKMALAASLIFHAFLFCGWPSLNRLLVQKSERQPLSVSYVPRRIPVSSDLISDKPDKIKPLAPPQTPKADELLKSKELSRPLFDLKASENKAETEAIDVRIQKAVMADGPDGKMLISHNNKDLSNEPSYIDYYNSVRAEIYKTANTNKPYYANGGDVRLVFVIDRSGRLLDVSLVESISVNNQVLRNHAVASIRKASPFAPFPATMKENDLTLRLTISFEK